MARPNSTRTNSRLRVLAEYDLFPAFSAKARKVLYNPLGVLLLAAFASLLCGLFLHAQGFVLCGSALAIVALGVVWPCLSLWGITGVLAFERPRAAEGDSIELSLRLHNWLPWGAWGLVVRKGFESEPNRLVAAIAAAPGRRTISCHWPFTPKRRCVYPLQTPELATGFPFGLWEYSRRLTVEGSLIVWPRTFAVGPIPPVRGDLQIEGNVSRNKVGSTGDVLGVRPYRRGDSPRRIHWGQSAKHDRLIVCELQSNARPVIQLVLDADPRVHAGVGENSSREWAIRIVASLAKGWLEDGSQVGLAWAGFDVPAASGAAQSLKILDALALVPDAIDQPLLAVLDCPRCRGFRDGLQVIVTTDRAQVHSGCVASGSDDQHWVILTASGFAGANDATTPYTAEQQIEPWLLVESAESVPMVLRGGWPGNATWLLRVDIAQFRGKYV